MVSNDDVGSSGSSDNDGSSGIMTAGVGSNDE